MRYARQTILDEVQADGQDALRKARVLIIGAGGLGSPVALYLAAAGVGHLGLVDADRVSVSNLQRQILFQTRDAGQLKGEVAKTRLEDLNPETLVTHHAVFLDSKNAEDIAKSYDILVDGSDNFETKYLLNDLAVKLGKPLVYGSILRWQGQVSVFATQDGPCYRCLFPKPPEGHVPNCAEAGVIGALAGVIGSLQALEVIKLLLPKITEEESLAGRLLTFDAKSAQTKIITLARDPECPVCSQPRASIPLPEFDLSAVCSVSQNSHEIERDFEKFHFIDVREEAEWERGHIPKALLWPLSELRIGKIPHQVPGAPTVIYCQSGVRSRLALNLLAQAGWDLSAVQDLPGGFGAWAGPVEQGM